MMAGCLFIAMLVLAQAMMVSRAFAIDPLTRVEQIRKLPRDEASRALPVKLGGVVIYKGWQNLVIHDGEAAIFLDFRYAQAQGVWKGAAPDLKKLVPGTEVEVEGVTDPGGFSPMVLVMKLNRIGVQPIPSPIRPTTEELLSSSHDTQWVEVEGVVRNMEDAPNEQQSLILLVGGHSCPVLLHNKLMLSREQLVDAKVRVRGVLLNIANLRSQTAGMKIHSNGTRDIDILVPPPKDPFQAPKVSLDNLITFRPDADVGHRKVSSGVVTFAVPGRFFHVEDQGACVRVDSTQADIMPGDHIEVSGFIETSRGLASFSGGLVRKIGTSAVPTPDEPEIMEILNPKTRSREEMVAERGHRDFDGRLIRLRGVLRRVLPPDKDGNLTVVIESDEHLVRALLPLSAGVPPNVEDHWIAESVVELTGACELEIARIDKIPWFSITGFHVWMSSSDDLRIVSEPPWWTKRRLGILLASVVVVMSLSLVWGYTMRRKVAVRGAQLASEISARESARLEFDTILAERKRLANDLHDTLEQALTGLALQLEIASRCHTSDPALSERHLKLARQFLERSRLEAHRTVWDLRAHGQDGRDFLEILGERVSSMVEGSDINITLDRDGDQVPLPDLIAGNLLLLAQEAVTNALKHSGASQIRIALKQKPDLVELLIADNGSGFEQAEAPGQADGHFGLQGMRERSKRLGGLIALNTDPGNGTIIHVHIPL